MSLLSPEQVAERCGLSRKAVYRAIERGELPASKLCSRLRIKSEDVDQWIAANEVGAAPYGSRDGVARAGDKWSAAASP
jgi:excisionase family DNA binding protein